MEPSDPIMKSFHFCNRILVAGFPAPVAICFISHRSSTYRLPPPKLFFVPVLKPIRNPLLTHWPHLPGQRQAYGRFLNSHSVPIDPQNPSLILSSLAENLLWSIFHQLISLSQPSSPTGILLNTADEQVN